MNKFTLSLVGLLTMSLFLFNACSDDVETIEGSWDVISLRSFNCPDTDDNAEIDLSNGCFDLTLAQICSATMDFKSNGTFEVSIETTIFGIPTTDTDVGTYTVSGNSVTICNSAGGECETGTYLISGNQMTGSYMDPDTGCATEFVVEK